jgi:hypothetical protein
LNWFKEFPRQEFLSLIASGLTEDQAMENINGQRKLKFGDTVLVQYQVKDSTFREELEEAKKQRADVWFNGIAKSVDKPVDKEAVPAEKLKFEQRKYLAAIDNPEKYSEKINHKMEIGINIFQEMKDLPQNEIRKMMQFHDPFSSSDIVEAELVVESGGVSYMSDPEIQGNRMFVMAEEDVEAEKAIAEDAEDIFA